MASVFTASRLRELVNEVLASVPEDAPPERVIAAMHGTLRAAFPGDIASNLRWSIISATYGTQMIAPLYVGIGEYLLFTGTPMPTGGETGRFWAHMQDYVLAGEIETTSAHRQTPSVFRRGEAAYQSWGRGGVFAVREHVWMLEHVEGPIPLMFTLPMWAFLFNTLNHRELWATMRNTTRLWLGYDTDYCDVPRWKNWLGNIQADPCQRRTPNNLWEVAQIVQETRAWNEANPEREPRTIRAVGRSHSWSPLVPTSGVLVDMSNMDTILDVDRVRQRITAQPGTPLRQLLEIAWNEGWRVRSVTAIQSLTLGGMLSVGAHGNDTSASTFSDDVVSIEFVDGTGKLRCVDTSSPQELRALRVALGTAGIVTALTIQCYPSSRFLYQVQTLTHDDVKEQAQIDALVADNELLEIYWYPFIDRVQVLTWNQIDEASPPKYVTEYGWIRRSASRLVQTVGQFAVGSPVAYFIDHVRPSLAWVLAWLSSQMFVLDEYLQTPLDAGHYLYAYHKVRDSGWAIPAEDAAAGLAAYRAEIERCSDQDRYPVNICVHLRFIRSGDSLLGFNLDDDAPAHVDDCSSQRLICQIEAAMTRHAQSAPEFQRTMERTFVDPRFGGRPHWAKEGWGNVQPFAYRGRKKWARFVQWRKKWDPNNIFANHAVQNMDRQMQEIEGWLADDPDRTDGTLMRTLLDSPKAVLPTSAIHKKLLKPEEEDEGERARDALLRALRRRKPPPT